MRQTLKTRFLYSIITIIVFLSLYLISKLFFSKSYLLEWTARHMYMGIWIIAIILLLFNKIKIGFSITIGNILGILIGQFLGDWIRHKNMLKTTTNTKPEIAYRLQHHLGVEIWILTLFLVVTICMLFDFIKKK